MEYNIAKKIYYIEIIKIIWRTKEIKNLFFFFFENAKLCLSYKTSEKRERHINATTSTAITIIIIVIILCAL